jgi:hypothetical protein
VRGPRLGFADPGDEGQVGKHRPPRQQGRLLEHHGAARGHLDAAVEIGVEAGEDSQERRLADPGGSDDRKDLARRQREMHAAEDRHRPEPLALDRNRDHARRQRVALAS